MPAIGLADHNGLYGAARFHAEAKRHGIKAHIDAEIAVAPLQLKYILAASPRDRRL
jgi:error-prone DNA polymerase